MIESTPGKHAELGGFTVDAPSLAAAFPDVATANTGLPRTDPAWANTVAAQAVRAAERAGQRLRLPLDPPTVDLEWSDECSPADALRAPVHGGALRGS